MAQLKVLDAFVGAVVQAASFGPHRALPARVLKHKLEHSRERSEARVRKIMPIKSYRTRWSQVSEHDLVELAEYRSQKRERQQTMISDARQR